MVFNSQPRIKKAASSGYRYITGTVKLGAEKKAFRLFV